VPASGSPVDAIADKLASENSDLQQAIATLKSNMEKLLHSTSAGKWVGTDESKLHTRASTLIDIVDGTEPIRMLAFPALDEVIPSVSSLAVDKPKEAKELMQEMEVKELMLELAARKRMERLVFEGLAAHELLHYLNMLMGADFLADEGDSGASSTTSLDVQGGHGSRFASHALHALGLGATVHTPKSEQVVSQYNQTIHDANHFISHNRAELQRRSELFRQMLTQSTQGSWLTRKGATAEVSLMATGNTSSCDGLDALRANRKLRLDLEDLKAKHWLLVNLQTSTFFDANEDGLGL